MSVTPPAPSKPSQSSVAANVGSGLLIGSLIFLLWMVFGGAYEEQTRTASIKIFGAYVIATAALYLFRLRTIAKFAAWSPALLLLAAYILSNFIFPLFRQ